MGQQGHHHEAGGQELDPCLPRELRWFGWNGLLVYWSGTWAFADHGVGLNALNIAAAKCDLRWTEAFIRGVLCNAMVCLAGNLLPVTLGNIVGGTLLVAGVYWFAYLRAERRSATDES